MRGLKGRAASSEEAATLGGFFHFSCARILPRGCTGAKNPGSRRSGKIAAESSDSSVRVRCLAKTGSRQVDEEGKGTDECTTAGAPRDGCRTRRCCDGALAVSGIRATSALGSIGGQLGGGDGAARGEGRTTADARR